MEEVGQRLVDFVRRTRLVEQFIARKFDVTALSFDPVDPARAAELRHLGALAVGRADADQDEIGIDARPH